MDSKCADWLTSRADGVRLSVKVTPRATIKLLARHRGAGSRRKVLDVQGETASLTRRLRAIGAGR